MRVRLAAAAPLAVAIAVAACSPSAGQSAGDRAARRHQGGFVLQATWTGYQLPAAISGAAMIARHGQLLVAGGAGVLGNPVGSVARLDPLTGRETPAGRLGRPVADGAVALIGGRLLMFGGWANQAVPTIQTPIDAGQPAASTRKAAIGQLPGGMFGLAALTIGSMTYLIGGADGAGPSGLVLRTADGRHFAVAGTLPVPVSYPAVAAARGALWVFGGLTPAGPSDVIQRVDLRSGHAAVAGRLPRPLAAASALVLGGKIFLAGGLTTTASGQRGSPSAGLDAATQAVLRFEPATGAIRPAGLLPMPVAHAASAVVNGVGYLVGGTDGSQPMPQVTSLRLVPRAAAVPVGITAAGASGSAGSPGQAGVNARAVGSASATPSAIRNASASPAPAASANGAAADPNSGLTPWLAPVSGPGHLAPGSDPSALPADVLVADHLNNRLVIIDPQGRVRWVFPRHGDLRPGQSFLVPDDAFFSPDGRYIVATQEDNQVISVINVAEHKIVYRYGKPGSPGSGPGRLDNPDDAMMMPNGDIIAADIKNCRIIVIRPPEHHPLRIIGQTTHVCMHAPPHRFGSPNGAFPMAGGYVVTEINGDWADGMTLSGLVRWSVNPPGVMYPSDTNEVFPGRYLTADYFNPGQVAEFNARGKLLWRFGGLNQPSLALPLPNGDVLVNDDFNHRVIVINPRENRIVWQYGHTGKAGRGPGYLNDPDGLDLVPPDSFLIRQAPTMGRP